MQQKFFPFSENETITEIQLTNPHKRPKHTRTDENRRHKGRRGGTPVRFLFTSGVIPFETRDLKRFSEVNLHLSFPYL